jgi:hypothetical protein
MESQKTLDKKVVGYAKIHITTKNGVNIQKFAMELTQTMVNWVESEVKLAWCYFYEDFSMKFWYAMFGIFPRYYIKYHDSMRWIFIF